MTHCLKRWAFAVSCLTVVSCSAFRSAAFLDATTVAVAPEPGHGIEFPGLAGGGWDTEASPVRVRLLKTDRSAYRRMDRIHYDVSVTNVANADVIFPWSAVPIHRRDRPETGYRHALFELTVKRAGYEDWVIATAVLYGAPNVPNSLRVIRPGDTVIIRLPGILSGGGYQDARNPVLHPDPTISVAVHISIAAPPTLERLYAVSENALPMTILPAEAQDK